MSNRFRTALDIVNPGACNPSGIAHSIMEACQEARITDGLGTRAITEDPAIRLMTLQLASICGVACVLDHDEYARA